MVFVPEWPAFHVKKGRREEAFRALKMYSGTNARDKDKVLLLLLRRKYKICLGKTINNNNNSSSWCWH
jgi:hypothetical protein